MKEGIWNDNSFDETLSDNSQIIISNNNNINNNIDNASSLLNLENIKNYRKNLNILTFDYDSNVIIKIKI